jgi:transposase
MAGFIEGVDRGQSVLFPERLDDWIGEDSVVRVVDFFVEELDLQRLGFARSAAARTGRPGYHPAVLLKLFIYGDLNRIPSSRRLEREAGRNVEVMWLTGKLVPDHKTIADFRRDNGAGIRKVCAQFVELCRRIGTLKGDCVAIDGSKFNAVNNRDKNFTKGKIASRIAHLEADVDRYITEMVRIGRQEEGEVRAEKVEHLSRRYGRIRQEIARLKEMDHALANAPDGQISLTNPNAHSMATSARHSGRVSYNVQSAVNTETHLIVAHEVTNQGFDRDQLSPMAIAAKATLVRLVSASGDRASDKDHAHGPDQGRRQGTHPDHPHPPPRRDPVPRPEGPLRQGRNELLGLQPEAQGHLLRVRALPAQLDQRGCDPDLVHGPEGRRLSSGHGT